MERSLRENRGLWELFEAITCLENAEETALFLRDLCTLGELESLAERWQVARLLEQGLSYRAISQKTGASTATVARIAHWVRHGEGGYRLLLERTGKRETSSPG